MRVITLLPLVAKAETVVAVAQGSRTPDVVERVEVHGHAVVRIFECVGDPAVAWAYLLERYRADARRCGLEDVRAPVRPEEAVWTAVWALVPDLADRPAITLAALACADVLERRPLSRAA